MAIISYRFGSIFDFNSMDLQVQALVTIQVMSPMGTQRLMNNPWTASRPLDVLETYIRRPKDVCVHWECLRRFTIKFLQRIFLAVFLRNLRFQFYGLAIQAFVTIQVVFVKIQ